MEGEEGWEKREKIPSLRMWPSKAFERPWERSYEGLYLYGFLKGRKEKGLQVKGSYQ